MHGMRMACAWYVHVHACNLSTPRALHAGNLTLALTHTLTLFKVENALKSSKYTQLPMVYATSNMSYAIALICPNMSNLKALASSLGVKQDDVAGMCANKDVIAAVVKDVEATCKAAKLSNFEIPKKVVLIEELWTPENDMLTAVQKLKRREIVAKHKAEIDSVYI